MMQPNTTHDAYLLVTTTAFELANNGHAEEGYTCLLTGLERAEELRETGEARAADLVARYRAALGIYTQKYGGGRD